MLYLPLLFSFFFFNDTATTEIYTLSLHDALPILNSLLGGDAQANPQEFLRAQRPDDRLHAVVSRRTASLTDADRAHGQVQFVVNHQQIGLSFQPMRLKQLANREPAQIHVRLGLGQEHGIVGDRDPAGERPAVPVSHLYPEIAGDAIHRQEAEIVRRELIFDSGIAQSNDQFHARSQAATTPGSARPDRRKRLPLRGSYFFSFFSAFSGFSGAASAPSSVSCLPFLITSGSAGAAAASAAA